jgi:manganese transport system substrate-binding protein
MVQQKYSLYKQLRLTLLCFSLLMGLPACGLTPISNPSVNPSTSTSDIKAESGKKVVLTTFTVLADIAQNVAGDKVVVESLIKPGAEIHGYEPTPSDLVRGQKADLILDNGLGLERWAERYYSNLPKVRHITLSEGIQPVAIAEDSYQGKPNPHAWMSPKNALIYVENIRKALTDLDPTNAATYMANAQSYSQKIRALDQKLQQAIVALPPEQRALVSCEGAFSYITRDYGMTEAYIWAVNAEQQATPRQIERTIQTVRQKRIPVVFCESTVSDEAQRQVAKAANAQFGGVLYVDSLSSPEGPAPTYLKLLEHNVTTVIQGLQSNSR